TTEESTRFGSLRPRRQNGRCSRLVLKSGHTSAWDPPAQGVWMTTCRFVLHAATFAMFMLASMTEASAANLFLYLVNSGATTHIFNDSLSADGDCGQHTVSGELSRSRGTLLRQDAVGDTVGGPNPTELSFTSDADFIVPAKSNAVTLKLWASSGD